MTPNDTAQPASLIDQLQPLLTDLLFPSESDEPVVMLTIPFDSPDPLSVSQLKNSLLIPSSMFAEEVPESWFWDAVTDQDYTDDESKARNAQFANVKTLLDAQLTNRQVFRVGATEIDVYLLGQLPDGSRAGLQTKVIET